LLPPSEAHPSSLIPKPEKTPRTGVLDAGHHFARLSGIPNASFSDVRYPVEEDKMRSDWQRSFITLAATVLTITVVAILYWARSILIPITLAVFMAFILGPLVAWLQHRGLGRTISVLLVVGLVILGSVGVGGVVTHQVVLIADTLPDREEAIKEKVAAAKEWLVGGGNSRFGQMINDVTEVLIPKHPSHQTVIVESASPPLTAQLQPFLSPSIEILGQCALTLILTVYMLIRREDLRNRMIRLLGDGRVTTTTKAVDEASQRISRYLLMQLIINTTFGLTISLGLLILGVNYVLLWGFIAAVMRYIPYIGTWIGLLPPLLFSFATSSGWVGGWGQPLVVLILYLSLELLCANVVEPWLYGSSMGLSEVAQLVAAAFWAFLWGPIGLILSSPLTACLLVLGKYVRGAEFLAVILGDEPALKPSIAFYQRLAARDQDEASEVALTVARTSSPDVALETVVIPALCLVRRDHDEGELDLTAFRYAIHAAREVAAEIGELREPLSGEQQDERVRVLVCPARDEAEHVGAEILAGALNPMNWEVRVAGDEMLASELVATVEEFRPAVVVLIALPPGGMSHCRYMVSRVRAKFAGVRVIVGRWGNEELSSAEVPSALKQIDAVDRTLSDTRKRLTDLHSVMIAEIEKRDADERNQKTGDSKQKEERDANFVPVLN
jgi:predicted PurR-regulated permease PerM